LDKYSVRKNEVQLKRPEWLTQQLLGISEPEEKPKQVILNPSNKSLPGIIQKPIKNEVIDQDHLVAEMLARIDMKADADTCRFLLESSDWDLDTAVDLFKSTY